MHFHGVSLACRRWFFRWKQPTTWRSGSKVGDDCGVSTWVSQGGHFQQRCRPQNGEEESYLELQSAECLLKSGGGAFSPRRSPPSHVTAVPFTPQPRTLPRLFQISPASHTRAPPASILGLLLFSCTHSLGEANLMVLSIMCTLRTPKFTFPPGPFL